MPKKSFDKNSRIIRTDPEFVKMINEILGRRLISKKERTSPRRITLAMVRQYKLYPNLKKELESADFK